MIQALIFDLDGVLVNTARYHFLAWQEIAHQLGVPFSEKDNERLKGVGRMESLQIILEIGKISMGQEEKEKWAQIKNRRYVDYIKNMKPSEVFPGVKDLLTQLKAKNYAIGLGSSSKNAALVLDILGLRSYFNAITDGTMITYSKPHPETFLHAANQLRAKPNQCLVFEDAQTGIDAALNAHMKCVAVGSSQTLKNAHLVIPKVADFNIQLLDTF